MGRNGHLTARKPGLPPSRTAGRPIVLIVGRQALGLSLWQPWRDDSRAEL
jgi:hypothetical protein